MEWSIVILYGAMMLIICFFSFIQMDLSFQYLKSKKEKKKAGLSPLQPLPFVTVQLPIYNEKYVIQRLIDAVAHFTYPSDYFEIQVLDDSTDETVGLIQEKIQEYTKKGIQIHHLRRENRVGYKAGALQYGLGKAKGEYIAIFDADFIPNKDFLQQCLPSFKNKNVGMVQTKWGHLNRDFDILTKVQAFWLDAHFTIEQKGREQAGSFINFNGTAGIWRKSCIKEAGGWNYDTLAEDLDLSYRAQLKGWTFVYNENITSPAELPVTMDAIKSQQYRWNKGGAEVARKTLKKIIFSKIDFIHKVRGVCHLLSSSVFLWLLIAAILSIPLLYVSSLDKNISTTVQFYTFFILGFLSISFFYWVSSRVNNPKGSFVYFIKIYPAFLTLSMGLSLHNAIAVFEGFLGIKTPFVRTPKFNVISKEELKSKKRKLKFSVSGLLELVLACYFIFGIMSAIHLDNYGLILFHATLSIGFGYIALKSMLITKNA